MVDNNKQRLNKKEIDKKIKFRQILTSLKLSQREFSNLVGIKESSISKILSINNERRVTEKIELFLISDLKVDPAWWSDGDDSTPVVFTQDKNTLGGELLTMDRIKKIIETNEKLSEQLEILSKTNRELVRFNEELAKKLLGLEEN